MFGFKWFLLLRDVTDPSWLLRQHLHSPTTRCPAWAHTGTELYQSAIPLKLSSHPSSTFPRSYKTEAISSGVYWDTTSSSPWFDAFLCCKLEHLHGLFLRTNLWTSEETPVHQEHGWRETLQGLLRNSDTDEFAMNCKCTVYESVEFIKPAHRDCSLTKGTPSGATPWRCY